MELTQKRRIQFNAWILGNMKFTFLYYPRSMPRRKRFSLRIFTIYRRGKPQQAHSSFLAWKNKPRVVSRGDFQKPVGKQASACVVSAGKPVF